MEPDAEAESLLSLLGEADCLQERLRGLAADNDALRFAARARLAELLERIEPSPVLAVVAQGQILTPGLAQMFTVLQMNRMELKNLVAPREDQ